MVVEQRGLLSAADYHRAMINGINAAAATNAANAMVATDATTERGQHDCHGRRSGQESVRRDARRVLTRACHYERLHRALPGAVSSAVDPLRCDPHSTSGQESVRRDARRVLTRACHHERLHRAKGVSVTSALRDALSEEDASRRLVTDENVSVDCKSPEDDVNKPSRKEYKCATARNTTSGPPAMVAALEKRYRGDDIEDAEPPDEWARENVYSGGSPLVIYGGINEEDEFGGYYFMWKGGNLLMEKYKPSPGVGQRAKARVGTVPYLGEQHAGATRTYGGDDNNRHGADVAMDLTLMGDNVDVVEDLPLVEKAPLRLLVMDAEDLVLSPKADEPPDECAPDNVYRGGSPLSIVGEVTCNVPNGLGIKIFYWWISFWMRFDGLD